MPVIASDLPIHITFCLLYLDPLSSTFNVAVDMKVQEYKSEELVNFNLLNFLKL